MRIDMLKHNHLEPEEQEILTLFEQGKLSSVSNVAEEIQLAERAAHQRVLTLGYRNLISID
jgi:hypothetical protein